MSFKKAFLVSSGIVLAFAIAFYVQHSAIESFVQDTFSYWSHEVVHEIFYDKSESILGKVSDQIANSGVIVKSDGFAGECFSKGDFKFFESNILVRKMGYCIPFWVVLENTLTSSLFIILSFGILMFSIIYSQISLKESSNALSMFLDYLDTGNLRQMKKASRTEIENRLFKLFFKNMKEKEKSLQLENKLIHSEEMAFLSKQVAHDLRSPLTALQVIVDTASGLNSDQQSLLKSSVERVTSISRDLMAKTKESLAEIQRESADVLSCIEVSILEKELEWPELEILIDNQAKSDLVVKINRSDLLRIFSNLFQNSAEAQAKSIKVKIVEKQHFVEIQFQDNGLGIAPENLSALFEPGATFNKVNGTGLGLFGIKRKLSSVKGRISIESEIAKGTLVTLLIPSA